MPDDAGTSTHANVAALRILALLQYAYDLPPIDTDDLHRIVGYIDEAIIDAGNLRRIKDAIQARGRE